MVPVSIALVISVVVTLNICLLGNISVLLIKIKPLIFLLQPGSSAKSVSAMLWARLGSIIAPTLPLKIVLMIQNQTLLSSNLMTLTLWKEKFLHLQILPAIEKGRKKVMKILMIFNGRVSTTLWLSIQLITLTLEEYFIFALPLYEPEKNKRHSCYCLLGIIF